MESFLFIIEILAVLAFAYSGVVKARRSGFDYVGVLCSRPPQLFQPT